MSWVTFSKFLHFLQLSVTFLLQKYFDMEKTYVDALWANKTFTEYRKTYQSSILTQDVPFLRNFNHKTYLSYI